MPQGLGASWTSVVRFMWLSLKVAGWGRELWNFLSKVIRAEVTNK